MKIVVLIKKTPDTEAKIALKDGAIETAGLKWIVNPYDEFAIEEALKIKEKSGSGEVVIATFGEEDCRELIVKGLAMGADRGLLIKNDGLEQADSLTVAKVLAAALKTEAPQVVLCGKQAIDDDNMHVGTMVAELLDWPSVNVVTQLAVEGDAARVEREVEGGQVEVYKVQLPAVFGAHKSLNTPRFAKLPQIMKAKKKPLDVKTPADFGLDGAALAGGVHCRYGSLSYPPEKPPGKVFQGEAVDSMVGKVVQLLRDEAKVI